MLSSEQKAGALPEPAQAPFSHLRAAAHTDVGKVRAANEDSLVCLAESGLFCVADGMGGAAKGEVASRWAVEALTEAFSANAAGPRLQRVHDAVNVASKRIARMAAEEGHRGAGTTFVAMLFDEHVPERATVLHAGDSRAYRMRDGKLELLTEDHSMATATGVKDDKQLPPIFRGVITRAVGLADEVKLDETHLLVKPGDVFLLCSDGLTRMLPERQIQRALAHAPSGDLGSLASGLVDMANEAGGEDNISVVLARADGPFPPPAIPRARGDGADHDNSPALLLAGQPSENDIEPPVAASTNRSAAAAAPNTVLAEEPVTGETEGAHTTRPHGTDEESASGDARMLAPTGRRWSPARVLPLFALAILVGGILAVFRASQGPQPPRVIAPPPALSPSSPRIETAMTVDELVPTDAPPLALESVEALIAEHEEQTGPAAPVEPATAAAATNRETSPHVVTQAVVAASEQRLTDAIDAALTNGAWGSVVSALQALSGAAAEVAASFDASVIERATMWGHEWSHADRDPGYAAWSLARYRELIQAALDAMGDGRLLDVGEPASADDYCRRLMQWKAALLDATGEFAARAEDSLPLAASPQTTTAAMETFMGTNGAVGAAVGAFLDELADLRAWAGDERSDPLPLMAVMHGPTDSLPRLESRRTRIDAGLLETITRAESAIREWRAEHDGPLLDLIDYRSQLLLRRYRDRQFAEGENATWPTEQDAADLKAISAAMAEFMSDKGE